MTANAKPLIRPLTREDAEVILGRNWIGRVAFCLRDRVEVEPIHYVYDAPWIFGRTSVGTKLATLAQNRWCAFETDEVRDLFDWESVVVKGPFYALNSPLYRSENYDRAVAALRHVIPDIRHDGERAPLRHVVFGVHASAIEGRSAVSDEAD